MTFRPLAAGSGGHNPAVDADVTDRTRAALNVAAVDIEDAWPQWRNLGLLAVATVLGLSLWFSATAVAPALEAAWGLTATETAWLAMAVQIGFVVGTFASGVLNLPDLMDARRLFALSALAGALANALFAVLADGPALGIVFRFLTGLFLAGVYPPGLKLAATWSRRTRGLAIGVIVGALAVGSASPHLIRSLFDFPWQHVVLVSSASAALGGAIVGFAMHEGPFAGAPARFDPRFIFEIVRSRGLRLAILGYLGHQWELYAMWTWTPILLVQVFEERGVGPDAASAVAFGVVAVGGLSSVVAGALADRIGRTTVTSIAMIGSGASALAAAALIQAPLWALVVILFIWGLTVVADSAQFSAAVTELSPPEYLGTALTLQTSVGFLVTLGSIQLVPIVFTGPGGWPAAFALLALGPMFGVAAMLRLRRTPEAARLAGGRR